MNLEVLKTHRILDSIYLVEDVLKSLLEFLYGVRRGAEAGSARRSPAEQRVDFLRRWKRVSGLVDSPQSKPFKNIPPYFCKALRRYPLSRL